MIETRGLTRRYGKLTALDDLDLKVGGGELYGFIGPNGAGKTTTIQILATLLQPTSGDAWVAGFDVRYEGREVRRAIGYMPDFFGLYHNLRVWEYLEFFAAAYDLTGTRRRSIVGDVLELTDLTAKREAVVGELSRGMQQRLGLARVLVHDPQVLLLDEPASGLDPRARLEVREILRELRAMGKTILLSSHILSELAEVCTSIGILHGGRLVASGPVAEVLARVGAGRTVRLRVDAAAADAAAAFAALDGVERVQTAGGDETARPAELKVSLSSDLGLPELAAFAVGRGLRLLHLEEERVDLEEAYLLLTDGREAEGIRRVSSGRSAARRRIAAVIVREMRALARYRTSFVLRTVYGALIAASVAVFFSALGVGTRWSGEYLAYFGFQSFTGLVWLQSFLALVLGILMGVVSVAAERRERTLGLVMLSQVRPAEVVLGKLTALLALLSTVLLAGLPVYALVGWAGGLDYFWFACMVVLTLVLAVLGIASGLAAAMAIKNGFGAVLGAASVLILPTFLGAIWQEPFSGTDADPLARVLASGLWAVGTVAQQDGDGSWFTVELLVLSAVAAAMLSYAVRTLPRAAAAGEGSGLRGVFERLDGFFEAINLGGIRFGRRRRSLCGDPVSWLTRTTSGTALMRYGFRLAAVTVIASMILAPWLLFDGGEELVWTLFGGGLIVAMVTLGAGGLGDEKARRSLSVLLATPLTAAQILHGKMRATLSVVVAVAWIPAALFLGFVGLADPGQVGETAGGIALLLAEGLCGYFLALYLSLHLASSLRAGIAAVLTLAAVHVVLAWSAAKAMTSAATVVLFSLAAVAVSVWAWRGGKPVACFAALLVAATTACGLLLTWIDRLRPVDSTAIVLPLLFGLLVAVALLSYLHARRIFDRALGRTP